MKTREIKKSKIGIVLCFFALIGLIILVLGGVVLKKAFRYRDEGRKTEAEIVRIERDRRDGSKTSHRVYVEFTADGKTYKGELHTYWAGMREGEAVEIYYMPDRPEDFTDAKTLILSPALLLTLGAAFFLPSSAIGAVKLARRVRLGRLKECGQAIDAEIIGCTFSDKLLVCGKKLVTLVCSDGRRTYRTRLLAAPGEFSVGDKVRVYADSVSPEKYVVDVHGDRS